MISADARAEKIREAVATGGRFWGRMRPEIPSRVSGSRSAAIRANLSSLLKLRAELESMDAHR